MKTDSKKVLYFVLGSIILGSLGSGFWEIALKPFFLWVGKLSLTIVTLGISSLEESIYQRVARGLVETPSAVLLIMFVGTITGLCFATIGRIYKEIKLKGKPDEKNKKKNLSSKKLWLLLIVITTTTTIINLQVFVTIYINYSAGIFRQSFMIIKPYIDNQEEEIIMSEFSRMKNKDEFELAMNKIKVVAEKEKVDLPEVDFWQ
jgi:hypothetical protein